jgi:hypothetical protein
MRSTRELPTMQPTLELPTMRSTRELPESVTPLQSLR